MKLDLCYQSGSSQEREPHGDLNRVSVIKRVTTTGSASESRENPEGRSRLCREQPAHSGLRSDPASEGVAMASWVAGVSLWCLTGGWAG